MDLLRERAERLLWKGAQRTDLAIEFQESVASTSEVLVAGRNFYPRLLEDVGAATSSIHVNQFGFRPGEIGEAFATALLAKARDGIRVRLVVDRQGSDPERASRQLYDRLVAGGIEVCVVRATQLRSPHGVLGERGPIRWNFAQLGHIDHRKMVVVDGSVGWVGGAGIEDHFNDGRFHDLFLRVTGPVVSQLQLVFVATFAWLSGNVAPGELDALFPAHQESMAEVPAVVLHNAPGRYRPINDAIAELLDGAARTLDVVNPYVTDGAMIRRIERAARRGVAVRLFVPADANNWACAAAQRFHHRALLDAGVRILDTRRCSTRRRSSGTGRLCLRERATSRPGASSDSSRSIFACARRVWPGSSTSASRHRQKSCLRRVARSSAHVNGSEERRSRRSRRYCEKGDSRSRQESRAVV